MKKFRVLLSAAFVFIAVGSALAFTARPYGQGDTWCTFSDCTSLNPSTILEDDTNGTIADPCNNGGRFIKVVNSTCSAIDRTFEKFKTVPE